MGRGKRHAAGRQGPRGRFNPTVSFVGGEVVVNLPELSLYGAGDDFEAAKADLLGEVRVYAEQFRASEALRRGTNRVDHATLIEELEAAEAAGRLEELLFASPAERDQAVAGR